MSSPASSRVSWPRRAMRLAWLMNLADTIAHQNGLVTRQQALASGMTPAALRHAIGPRGRWQRVMRGVYATFTGELTPRQRLQAALLHAGADAVLSGVDACRAHGLVYVPGDAPITVLVPNERQPAGVRGMSIVRVRRMPRVRYRSGLPVADPARAVLDACLAMGSLRDVRALVCEAVQRGVTTPALLADEAAHATRPGTQLFRRAVADTQVGCRSAPECELNDIMATSTVLPQPMRNVALPGVHGIVPDFWWLRARLVVEVDSREFHQFGTAPEATQRRHARLAAAGWVVLPVSPRRLREDPQGVLREIEGAYLVGLRRAAAIAG